MTLTPLSYALLGLMRAKPQSGYALRMIFESTPMGAFSSSPGSIYPALNKLSKAGLAEKRPAQAGGKPIFHATTTGAKRLVEWITAPVTLDQVANAIDVVLLRFAFLQSHSDTQVTRDFLSGFESATRTHINNLQGYLESPEGQRLSRHGRLAVENGLAGYRAHLDWCQTARQEFSK